MNFNLLCKFMVPTLFAKFYIHLNYFLIQVVLIKLKHFVSKDILTHILIFYLSQVFKFNKLFRQTIRILYKVKFNSNHYKVIQTYFLFVQNIFYKLLRNFLVLNPNFKMNSVRVNSIFILWLIHYLIILPLIRINYLIKKAIQRCKSIQVNQVHELQEFKNHHLFCKFEQLNQHFIKLI